MDSLHRATVVATTIGVSAAQAACTSGANVCLGVGITSSVELPDLSPNLLKHLLSLEKLKNHDLGLTFVKVNLALG